MRRSQAKTFGTASSVRSGAGARYCRVAPVSQSATPSTNDRATFRGSV
jgi:hypothetical protein